MSPAPPDTVLFGGTSGCVAGTALLCDTTSYPVRIREEKAPAYFAFWVLVVICAALFLVREMSKGRKLDL